MSVELGAFLAHSFILCSRAVISAKMASPSWCLTHAFRVCIVLCFLPTSAVHVLVYTWFARAGQFSCALNMDVAQFHRTDLAFFSHSNGATSHQPNSSLQQTCGCKDHRYGDLFCQPACGHARFPTCVFSSSNVCFVEFTNRTEEVVHTLTTLFFELFEKSQKRQWQASRC